MKHTKKMIMIPEMEYETLINMLKNKDELGFEKAKVDTKIGKTLKNKQMSELLKGKKYDWLIKQQQQIRKKLASEAEKPQKVMLDKEQIYNMLADISKYLGVEPTKTKIGDIMNESQETPSTPILSKSQKKKLKQKAKASPATPQEEEFTTPKASPIAKTSSPIKNPSPLKYVIHPNYYNDLKNIIKNHTTKLKINKNGQLLDDYGHPIEGSNYTTILDHLTGKNIPKPPGTDLLLDRMKGEKYYKTALEYAEYHRQRGEGKKLNLYKTTRGLIRRKQTMKQKFQPQLWARI